MLEKTSQGETTLFGNRFWGQPGCRLQDFLQLSLRLLVPADATLSQKNPLLVTVATSTPTTRMSISGSFQPLLEDFPCTQLDSPNPHSIARKVSSQHLPCKELQPAFKPGAGLRCKGTCSSSPHPSLSAWHHEVWLKVVAWFSPSLYYS